MHVQQRLKQIWEILDHPVNRPRRFRALVKYLKWNLGRRLLDEADYLVQVNDKAQVILSNNENYATLAYTCGLYDYSDMSFLVDFLESGDVFGDFGANVGVYSVLAGTLGARLLSVEPVPRTFHRLCMNLRLNEIDAAPRQCGLSDSNGKLHFTSGLGGMNHVAKSAAEGDIEVEVITVDDLIKSSGLVPTLIKIDVEGFELPLLKGASSLLKQCEAIIIELNGSGIRFGYSDDDVHQLLLDSGFACFDYVSSERKLTRRESYNKEGFNSLYINLAYYDAVVSRLSAH